MERVNDTPNSAEVFENDIELYLQEFAERDGIEDYKQVGQSVWNAALRYIYSHVFKPNPDILKSHTNISVSDNIIPSNYNAYNYDLVNEVCDYYIYNMCMRYNKEVSILGFTTGLFSVSASSGLLITTELSSSVSKMESISIADSVGIPSIVFVKKIT